MEFNILPKTPLYKALSDVGKRIFLPDGIFYWAGRAKTEAIYSATLGAAYAYEKDFIAGGSSEWIPCYLNGIHSYCENFNVNQIVPYPPISGVVDLRLAWKDFILQKSPYSKNMEGPKYEVLDQYITLPIITNGVTNAIYSTLHMILNPNEFIIAPNKRWGNYDNIVVRLLGARIKSFQFFEGGKFNLNGLKQAIEEIAKIQKKIIIILNFPNNPTGYVPSSEEMEALIQLLVEENHNLNLPIIVLVDDAYEPYVFDDSTVQHSIFYKLQQLNEDIIPVKLDGVTKELLLYGARIGFITIGLKQKWVENQEELQTLKKEIDNKLSGLIRSTISNCNHFYQNLVLKLLKEQGIKQIFVDRNKVKDLLKSRYELINEHIASIRIPGISIDPNSGGYFLFINIDPKIVKASVIADHLLKKYKVGIIPIEKPEDNINGIRIAYCSINIDQIPEFIKRIKSAFLDFLNK
ncbi:MAG: aminotransferase class I/II-fold pyridoxal phosphate-dependent enzyme [Promethearchaeota archaeon]|nr:MAG: aminotransferase class I/II-fold pyridoxal phosphate-dependent enzyme [Candidatus Lokiarchaeota archaeon]